MALAAMAGDEPDSRECERQLRRVGEDQRGVVPKGFARKEKHGGQDRREADRARYFAADQVDQDQREHAERHHRLPDAPQ